MSQFVEGYGGGGEIRGGLIMNQFSQTKTDTGHHSLMTKRISLFLLLVLVVRFIMWLHCEVKY